MPNMNLQHVKCAHDFMIVGILKKPSFSLSQAQNSADREPRSARILLLVEYAPHVSVKVKINGVRLIKFDLFERMTLLDYNHFNVSCFRQTACSPRGRTSTSPARHTGTPSRCPTGKLIKNLFFRVAREKYIIRVARKMIKIFFRWFLSNAIVPGNHGTLLRLDGLDRSQNGAIVKCEVSNAIGKSEETQTLDIHCEWEKWMSL